MRNTLAIVLFASSLTTLCHCSRSNTTETPQNPTPHTTTAQPPTPTPTPTPPTGGSAPTTPTAEFPAPSGPSSQISGEHYALNVTLAAPSAVPGSSTLQLEVRATDGYHMNELYPSRVELQVSNATAPTEVRRGGEGVEISQEQVRMRVPVQVAAAGATVRGTARFAICSADTCIPQTRTFAVALP